MKKLSGVIFCVLFAAVLLSSCGKSGALPRGSTAGGEDIGGMSRDEAIAALGHVTLGENESVTVKTDIYTLSYDAGEINARYDAEKTVDNILNAKRGFFDGVKSLFKKTNYSMAVVFDENLLDGATSNKLYGVEREPESRSFEITAEGVAVRNGSPGVGLDREKLGEALCEQFGKSPEEREKVVIDLDKTYPEELGNDEFLAQLNSEAADACYVRLDDGSIAAAEGKIGVKLNDYEYAKAIMQSHTKEGEEYLLPAEVNMPRYTKAELEACLFADTLATYSSSFASSAQNRSDNIALATSKINNVVLMPGETFSFNEALGERTVQNGYKTAHAYAAGEVVDQVGGGICQVSSTLYNAALLSNLTIVERRSHQMTVSYVPLGRDATVNWGTQDFRFNNNTYYPIKIEAYTSGKKVYISVIGTKPDKSLKVEIETKTLSETEPPVKTEEDPTLPEGETKVVKTGSKGYVVDAYRVVYSSGAEISREKLKRSTYNPTQTVMKVGTMQPEPVTEPIAPQDAAGV